MVEVTQAMQFTGDNCQEILRFIGNPEWDNPMLHNTDLPYVGDKVADPGDWIIKTGEAVIITTPRDAAFNAALEAVETLRLRQVLTEWDEGFEAALDAIRILKIGEE